MPRPDAALARLAEQAAPLVADHTEPRRTLRPDADRRASRRGSDGQPASWYHVGPVVSRASTRPRGAAEADDPDDELDDDVEPGEPGEDPEAPEQPEDAPAHTSADVYVFESIGGWFGVTADDFVRDVATLDVEHIDLHLNSPGGDVFDAAAIANVLRAHPATITVWVDGLAASAASTIAMSGDEIVMGVGSQLMIHDAWTVGIGNAGDLRQTADLLDSVSNTVAETYAARAGGTREGWREAMLAETWYTPSEAVQAGLADRVATDADRGRATGQQVTPGAAQDDFWAMWDSLSDASRFDLTAFTHAGRQDAPAPAMPARAQVRDAHAPAAPGDTPRPPAPAGSATPRERSAVVDFPDDQVTSLRSQLGLPENADGAAILAALQTRLDQPPATISDQVELTALRNEVAEQRKTVATLTADRETRAKKEFFTAQARRGAITKAERGDLEAAYDKAPGVIRALLEGRSDGERVAVSELGYTGDHAHEDDPAATDGDDAYRALFPHRFTDTSARS